MQTEGTKNLASMPQVEENIGGRHDQKKNQSRTTKTWAAVGLLMMVGCFAVGYFRATTTTTATTTVAILSSASVRTRPPKKQCTADGFCPRDRDICSHSANYPTYNCCSRSFTTDSTCLTQPGGCAVRCGISF